MSPLGMRAARYALALLLLVVPLAVSRAAPAAEGCGPESVYDGPARYGTQCERQRYSYGPIVVRPGQNDLLHAPVVSERPKEDGSIVRISVELVDALGTVAPVDQLHLHHAVWITPTAPFFAGEERTIIEIPDGYAIPYRVDEPWLLQYMVHNFTAAPRVASLRYTIDFVRKSAASALGLRQVRTLEVTAGQDFPGAPRIPFLATLNVQAGFGQPDAGSFGGMFPDALPTRVCTFPKENCARMNPRGEASPQQGATQSGIAGAERVVRISGGGLATAVLAHGHAHVGVRRIEVSIERDLAAGKTDASGAPLPPQREQRPIFISDALYPNDDGASPTASPSAGLVLTAASARHGWKVLLRDGDIIRLNAVYDTAIASWYDQMGIGTLWFSPGDASGVDVFAEEATIDPGPLGDASRCGGTIHCIRGAQTRPVEPSPRGGCTGTCALPQARSRDTAGIFPITAFSYGDADLGTIALAGLPRARVGQTLRFVNLDTSSGVTHTVTRCSLPCTGATGASYPLADGGTGPGDGMDFDSSELGLMPWQAGRATWDLTPDSAGLFTFFCRIHPSMRGAFEVVA